MKNKVFAILIVACILSVVVFLPAFAEDEPTSPLADQTWVRLGGPPGGIGYEIKVNPSNPDIWYVTDAFAGIHKSTDRGVTWSNSNEGIDVRVGFSGDAVPVFCVTIDPNNHNVIWIGLQGQNGIFRSSDAGETWDRRTQGIVENGGLTIRGIAVEPENSDIVYAAGEISSWVWAGREIRGREFEKVRGVLYKSKNGGESWTAIWRGENLARYLLIDPNDTNILYMSTGIFDREAANSNYEEKVSGGEGVLKSIDSGKTWNKINVGLENLYVGSIALHPTDSNILLAGVGNLPYPSKSGVYISRDAGETWIRKVGTTQPIEAVAFSSSNSEILYAAGEGFFFRSDDGGMVWKEQGTRPGYGWGPDRINPGQPIDIQVDPENSQRVFVNNYAGGNIMSEDGGVTWANQSDGYTCENTTAIAIHPDNPAIIYTNGKGGFFKSLNGGKSWTGILPSELMGGSYQGEIVIDPLSTDTIFASGFEGTLHKSTDGTNSWKEQFNYSETLFEKYFDNTRYFFQGITDITFAPSDSNVVYAGFGYLNCTIFIEMEFCNATTDYTLFISDDAGISWDRNRDKGTEIEGLTITDIEVHSESSDIAWVATPTQGIYKTTNRGESWEKLSASPQKVMSLALNPHNSDLVLAGSLENGIYLSHDGGASWIQSGGGMEPNESILDIVFDSNNPNVIYAASRRSGVYLSKDQGTSWIKINSGLSTRSVRTLSLSKDSLTLYAGTDGEGVFRLSTHDQEYFDSLAPTPISPTGTPTEKAITTPTIVPTEKIVEETPSIVDKNSPKTSSTDFTWMVAFTAGVLVLVFLFISRKKNEK